MDLLAACGVTIVGGGRLGSALAKAFSKTPVRVAGPVGRAQPIVGDIVLFAVPDREIGMAVERAPADAIVGHAAGALTLDVLGQREAFSFHPLMTFAGERAEFA